MAPAWLLTFCACAAVIVKTSVKDLRQVWRRGMVAKNKMRKFASAPFSNKVLHLNQLYWQLKTQLYYRFMFKCFGRGSVIRRPMLICNADCIEIADCVSIRDGVRLEAIRDPYGRSPSLTIGANTLIEQDVQIVCHNRVAIGHDVSIAGRCAIVDVSHPYADIRGGNIGRSYRG